MQGQSPIQYEDLHKMLNYWRRGGDAMMPALILLGCCTGFRISELTSLNVEDVLADDGRIRPMITVARRNMKGRADKDGKKGNKKSRTVKLSALAVSALDLWIPALQSRASYSKRQPLFLNCYNRRLTRFNAYHRIKTAGAACGVQSRLATHSMRKTFAKCVYDFKLASQAAGQPVDVLFETSKALGHADTKSTAAYLSFSASETDDSFDAVGRALS
jgi:integrase